MKKKSKSKLDVYLDRFKKTESKTEKYCECKKQSSIYTVMGEWGYWLFCSDCKNPLEFEFHYYTEPSLE